jgi:hypothetical protein
MDRRVYVMMPMNFGCSPPDRRRCCGDPVHIAPDNTLQESKCEETNGNYWANCISAAAISRNEYGPPRTCLVIKASSLCGVFLSMFFENHAFVLVILSQYVLQDFLIELVAHNKYILTLNPFAGFHVSKNRHVVHIWQIFIICLL